jgi:hypothetical protein
MANALKRNDYQIVYQYILERSPYTLNYDTLSNDLGIIKHKAYLYINRLYHDNKIDKAVVDNKIILSVDDYDCMDLKKYCKQLEDMMIQCGLNKDFIDNLHKTYRQQFINNLNPVLEK